MDRSGLGKKPLLFFKFVEGSPDFIHPFLAFLAFNTKSYGRFLESPIWIKQFLNFVIGSRTFLGDTLARCKTILETCWQIAFYTLPACLEKGNRKSPRHAAKKAKKDTKYWCSSQSQDLGMARRVPWIICRLVSIYLPWCRPCRQTPRWWGRSPGSPCWWTCTARGSAHPAPWLHTVNNPHHREYANVQCYWCP